MLFKEGTPLYSYEIVREGDSDVIYINYLGAPIVPNIAEEPDVMARVIEILTKTSRVSRIVFVQQRNYNYDSREVLMLKEIATLYTYLTKQQKILSPSKLSIAGTPHLSKRYEDVSYLLLLLKRDPIACYFELRDLIKKEKREMENVEGGLKIDYGIYIKNLEEFYRNLQNTQLIKEASKYFSHYRFGDREIYSNLFRPDIIPNFAFTRLVAVLPKEAEIVEQYSIGKGYDKSTVTILKKKDDVKYIYHLSPPEYSLNEEKQNLLNLAKNVLVEHQPKAEEFTDPEKTREVFFNISRDLVKELAENRNIKLEYEELNKLASILVRHTIGFGLIEVLLQDENLQDILINAPVPLNPIYVRHQEFDECITNIIPSIEDAQSWATKFRMISGRPLDEANPILDTELVLENVRARVAVIQQPLSPKGLAYALRRHRGEPWTLPLFIKYKMMNSFTAGLLSFLVEGARTILIAGTRGSGKTSLLGSLMLEIMPKYRIVVIEDTLELPVDTLRKLKYDILRMKVRSSLLETSTEVSADEGIRTSLRLGDSCLIVGEVRSVEAKALFEAMRVGALANVVAGTIHGANPYAVFDRVVNDLGVPVTSFKAIDCLLVANPVKTPDGLRSMKRVIQLSEIRKHWIKDPLEEGGFADLLKYNVEKDELEPTDELINGDSEIIKAIASNVKGWAGNWDAIWDNIMLRAKVKEELVKTAEKLKMPKLLEAKFTSLSNTMLSEFSKEVREEIGLPLSEKVFPLWQKWLKKTVRGKKI